jgi:hypothetical protein
MASRRDFLHAAGTLAAGWAAVGLTPDARAQTIRKEIRISGKKITVVDIHAHCAFPEISERVPGANAPRVAPRTLVLGPERFRAMDERGVDVQALSVNTYWARHDRHRHQRAIPRRRGQRSDPRRQPGQTAADRLLTAGTRVSRHSGE